MSDWNSGPDALYPANSFTCTKLTEGVKLRLDDGLVNLKPMSIYSKFKMIVDEVPMCPALAHKVNGKWVYIKYQEYWDLSKKAAKSFIKLGLKPNTCVGIIGFNAVPWVISEFGAIFAGGVCCGIYTTNSAEACEYALKDSGAEIIVVENKEQLDKILKCMNTCKVTAIIQYTGQVTDKKNGLIKSWEEFMELGKDVSDESLNNRVKTLAPNRCSTLIYTSGTTGNPKAAMISHDNVIYTAEYLIQTVRLRFACERVISYLPLSHIAGQLIDIFGCCFMGATLYFAQPDALKGTLGQTLNEVKPTAFFGVPRVWEKMHEKIEKVLTEQSKLKLSIFNWATKVGHKYVDAKFHGGSEKKISYMFANAIVLGKIRKTLGLDECKLIYSGAAPVNKKTLDFFISLGFPMCEVFGMSESTGPHCVGLMDCNRIGSVGCVKNTKHNKTKINQPDENGDGELCVYGRHVFMGYMNHEDKTKETFDRDNYLMTGDVAKLDKDKFLFITGRIKELIITAGGENVAPVPMEDNIKNELSNVLSNCMVVGDKRKFLTVLVTLKCKLNLDTYEPQDELTDELIQYCKTLGAAVTTVSDIIRNPSHPLYAIIDKGIKKANDLAISRVARVQKFSILPKDFSLPGNELGPTLKLRRQIVAKKYSSVIEKMYEGEKD